MPSLDPKQLEQLIARTALRDQGAFAELYRQCSPRLYALALRVVRREDWAEEVVQECFVSVWHRALDYRPADSAPMTWMTTIVRNRAIDWLRRPDMEIPDVDDSIVEAFADPAHSPLEQLLRADEAGALARCLEALEAKPRQLICLAFLQGLSHSDLAARMQLPLGSVKSWIRRGLMQLKGCLSV